MQGKGFHLVRKKNNFRVNQEEEKKWEITLEMKEGSYVMYYVGYAAREFEANGPRSRVRAKIK